MAAPRTPMPAAVGTDHRVESRGNHHERQTQTDDKPVFQRVGAQHIGGAEEIQDGVDEPKKNRRQQDADHNDHGQRIAHTPTGFGGIPLAQFQAQVGGAAVTDHQREGQRHDGDGKHHVGGAVAQVAYPPADEDLVYNVVQ